MQMARPGFRLVQHDKSVRNCLTLQAMEREKQVAKLTYFNLELN